jgi:hypothetical protein
MSEHAAIVVAVAGSVAILCAYFWLIDREGPK